MPTIVVKAEKDLDLYVGWSSIVEAPVWYGPREFALQQPDVTPERLGRADDSGTSALYGNPPREGAWDDKGLIYMQLGVLPRGRLRALIEALDAGNSEDGDGVRALLDPFED